MRIFLHGRGSINNAVAMSINQSWSPSSHLQIRDFWFIFHWLSRRAKEWSMSRSSRISNLRTNGYWVVFYEILRVTNHSHCYGFDEHNSIGILHCINDFTSRMICPIFTRTTEVVNSNRIAPDVPGVDDVFKSIDSDKSHTSQFLSCPESTSRVSTVRLEFPWGTFK